MLVYNTTTKSWENITLTSIAAKIATELGYASLQTAITTLNSAIGAKADANNVYTKSETDVAINTAIASTAYLKRIIVDSVEKININADDALNYIYMVPTGTVYGDNKYDEYLVIEENDGTRSKERVGSWEVNLSDYAKISDVTAALVNKADKSTSLSGYGILDAYTKTEIDATLSAINAALAAETKRSTDADTVFDTSLNIINTKLNSIASGAQVNIIDSVNTSEFTISNKNLELKEVPAAKLTGLELHDTIKNLIASINTNTTNIATNTSHIQNVTNTLNGYVRQERYAQDIANLTDVVTWHKLYS